MQWGGMALCPPTPLALLSPPQHPEHPLLPLLTLISVGSLVYIQIAMIKDSN